ncbi:MAG TPA: EAL domain-containing protein [Azospirillaceae bacterium]|nr:EAL domain-containing protein [Azospirillaceae bacterium]
MPARARPDIGSEALGRLARSDAFLRRDLQACLRAVAETACAVLAVTRAGVWLYNEAGDAIECVTLCRLDRAPDEAGAVLRQEELPAYFEALAENRVVAVADILDDPRTGEFGPAYHARTGIRALVDAPVLLRGALTAILCCEQSAEPRAWTPEEMAFTASLADFVALALANEENRLSEERARSADRRYRDLFENAVEGIFQMSPDGRFMAVNPALVRLLGYERAEQMLSRREPAGALFVSTRRRDELRALMDNVGRAEGFETEIHRADGPVIWISVNIRAVPGEDGRTAFFEGTVEDITHRKRTEAQLAHQALHDNLTQLPNRTLLADRLSRALVRARLRQSRGCAAILLDIDNFRLVNTTLGPTIGDRMLVVMARRLKAHLNPGDTLARLGRDDFVVVVEDVADDAEALARADALREVLSAPLELEGNELFPTASVGVLWDDGARSSPEELLRDLGIAVHAAKAKGKGRTIAFETAMRTGPQEALRLQSDLRKALERDEFELHYQPIVDLRDSALIGFEALVRWRHPSRGMVPPSLFIPAAEESGLIAPLGDWILRAACTAMGRWQGMLAGVDDADRPLRVSINMSPVQLVSSDLIDTIDRILGETGAEVARLRLEVTEAALSQEVELVSQRLEALRQRGFQVLIDDFGTGYSSLSRLHRLPFDGLKIDQSFIRPMLFDADSASIVRTVVALGQGMNVRTVAEGVEDAETAEALLKLGCDRAQGYHFARPMPAADADRLVGMRAKGAVALPLD